MGRNIRVVVGEGRTGQQGLLRFVLEGEGLDVVGEARTSADLALAVAEGQPDVVVLDDGIGVTAVSMIHEVLPKTKIVLVWPSAVVPIGGDARVEPTKILDDLGPAVRHVAPAGVGAATTGALGRPDWIEEVAGRTAPVVPLPVAAEVAPTGTSSGAGAVPAGPTEERSEWNRRLGTLALSGAAAVSALVLALALGGGRVTPEIVRGGGFLPPGTGFTGELPVGGVIPGGSPGASGYSPAPGTGASGSQGPRTEPPRSPGGEQAGGGSTDLLSPSGGDQGGGGTVVGGDQGGGGGVVGGDQDGGNGGGGGNGNGGGGDHDDDDDHDGDDHDGDDHEGDDDGDDQDGDHQGEDDDEDDHDDEGASDDDVKEHEGRH